MKLLPRSLLYDGCHDLPVLLRVAQGKQLWLHLKGTTLPASAPHLHLPLTASGRVQLQPVAIGTPVAEAPVQVPHSCLHHHRIWLSFMTRISCAHVRAASLRMRRCVDRRGKTAHPPKKLRLHCYKVPRTRCE